MRQKLIVSAVASAVLSSVVPAAFAVPSSNCPASSGGVITIPNGLAVVAVEQDACTLANGESIVVESGGSITIDQAPYAGETSLQGIYAPGGLNLGSIDVAGDISVGNNNIRQGISFASPLSGALTVSGSVTAISSSSGLALYMGGTVSGDTMISGTVTAQNFAAVDVRAPQTLIDISDTGIVEGASRAFRVFSPVTTLQNAGQIRPFSATPFSGGVLVRNNVGTLANASSGDIIANDHSDGAVNVNNDLGTLNNAGSITGTSTGAIATPGVKVYDATLTTLNNQVGGTIQSADAGGIGVAAAGGLISMLDNQATISGAVDGVKISDESVYYTKYGEITSLTNMGSIDGASGSDINSQASRDTGGLGTLNNLQSGLTFTGVMPANYNIIIADTSSFGSLSASSVTNSTTFGIDLVNSTTVTDDHLYEGVLSGVAGANLAGTSGTSGAYSWVLRNPGVDLTAWDLCVGNCDAPVDTDGDGIPDSDDDYPNADTEVTGGGVTLRTLPGTNLSSCSINESSFDPDAPHAQPAVELALTPVGRAVSFSLEGCSVGETIQISVDFEMVFAPGSTVHKIDPVSGWSAAIPGATIVESVVSYSVKDGGELDQDGVANGVIVDPVSVALSQAVVTGTPIPTLPVTFLGLLSALIGWAGVRKIK